MEENVFTFAFAQCGSTLHYSKTKTVCSCVFSVEDVVGDDICQLGYRSGTVNSNTVNSKFHLIRSFFEIFATFLLFHI